MRRAEATRDRDVSCLFFLWCDVVRHHCLTRYGCISIHYCIVISLIVIRIGNKMIYTLEAILYNQLTATSLFSALCMSVEAELTVNLHLSAHMPVATHSITRSCSCCQTSRPTSVR